MAKEGVLIFVILQEKGGKDARTNSEFLRTGPDLIDGMLRLHEGARDGISRFEALSAIIGHWVRCVRLGEISPEEAWEAVRDHNAALISPPWDDRP